MQLDPDDIDLVALVTTLWSEKMVITVFVLIATFLGGLYNQISKVEYEISLHYEINSVPPFRTREEIYADIKRNLFDEDIFSLWKKSTLNSTLDFAQIDDPMVINEFVFDRAVEDKFIVVLPNKVLIRTDDVELALELSAYLKFVGTKISEVYQTQAENKRALINQLSDIKFSARFLSEGIETLDRVLAVEEYLENILDGEELLLISRPRVPVITSTSQRLVLAMSLIIGGVVGMMFVLARSAVRKRSSFINQAAN